MREIKFRAWDTFNAVYYYSKDYKNLAEFFAYCQKCIEGGHILIFEEFTGLLDKKGKEIYEGDIVRYLYTCNSPWYSDSHGIITWNSTGFKLECFKGKGKVNGWLVSIPHDEGKLFEIIGNIYENPKLLKEHKND